MEKLVNAYNPLAAANVMCRNTFSVGWDGYLYDCDFNQMLELKVNCNSRHISNFNIENLNDREITSVPQDLTGIGLAGVDGTTTGCRPALRARRTLVAVWSTARRVRCPASPCGWSISSTISHRRSTC